MAKQIEDPRVRKDGSYSVKVSSETMKRLNFLFVRRHAHEGDIFSGINLEVVRKELEKLPDKGIKVMISFDNALAELLSVIEDHAEELAEFPEYGSNGTDGIDSKFPNVSTYRPVYIHFGNGLMFKFLKDTFYNKGLWGEGEKGRYIRIGCPDVTQWLKEMAGANDLEHHFGEGALLSVKVLEKDVAERLNSQFEKIIADKYGPEGSQ